ncbi:MAG TPA: LamG domain-containing protein [Baekduia sp.]|nr:LamG domain-containing protein [Baekduia sp.]
MKQGRSAGRTAVVTTVLLLAALCGVTAGAGTAGADTSAVVGQWRFDEAGGQAAVDDGPYALDGRLGLTDDADARDPERIAGLSGNALRFDGRALVRLPNAAALEPSTLTLEAVVRGTGSPGRFLYVVSHGANGCLAGSYGLYTAADGGMAFYIFDGEVYRVSSAVAPGDVWNGQWHHVAGVFDGRVIRFYLDGHPVGSAAPAPPTIAYALTSSDTYFGTYQGGCSLPLRGDIDLVRMWRGPLAPDTVGTLADAALAGPVNGGPPAGTVPTTDAAGSVADAPASRTTLSPVAGGQAIPLKVPLTDPRRGASAPGAPARACVVNSSTGRLRVGLPKRLIVKVALRGTPLKGVQVVATQASSRARLASGRTATDGRARLHVMARRRGTVRLQVKGRSDCGATALTVLKAQRTP